ncbi:hypothetical protein [Nevskia ramosa]|uniref:hypothetical protein n=1 Tax=Nevskia ramosa TaxID=64002 RepID=UPI003D0D3E17
MTKKWYGFFSKQALLSEFGMFGGRQIYSDAPIPTGAYWSTPDGGEVLITAVWRDPEAAEYLWPDKQCVGEVAEYLRPWPGLPEPIEPA